MTTAIHERTPVERIAALGIVPVVELPSIEAAHPMVEALLDAGVDIVEITFRTPAAAAAIAELRAAYPAVLVGAGTVRTVEAAERALDASASFIVAPSTNPAVIQLCIDAGVPVLPGVCTATEIDVATVAGVDVVKLFPAEAIGGVAYLRSLLGPYSDIRFFPTGGIDADNLVDYLRIPQVIACGGSWMVTPVLLREGNFERVRALAHQALMLVAEVRADA